MRRILHRTADGFRLSLELKMPYGNIAIIVFWIVVIKMWIQHGPRIPLIGIGIYFLIYLGVRALPQNPVPFQLWVCLLGIGMLLIDRVKSNPWR